MIWFHCLESEQLMYVPKQFIRISENETETFKSYTTIFEYGWTLAILMHRLYFFYMRWQDKNLEDFNSIVK